ncbi:MAG: methyltransferase domain-containing protein [Hyphomonadaceae bacterium]|nr:methyltransferase domain-containing protein [Hyphomonadaceae bacterium]
MAADNSEQIADWNGPLGKRWVEFQDEFDRFTQPFGEAALKAAAARPGEQVIDVGCGCGGSTLELARQVAPGGKVNGIDVSQPMLELARRRAAAAKLSNVTFAETDASNGRLPMEQDLLFSRFGVMFFAAPVPAFEHLRRSLKDRSLKNGGRMAFVCWRAPRENPWAMLPLLAAREALGVVQPKSDPHAPGPFAFADQTRVRAILLEANFRDVDAEPFDAAIRLGSDLKSAAETAVRTGPVSRFMREHGAGHEAKVLEAVSRAIEPLAGKDGFSLTGATWIVTAKAG